MRHRTRPICAGSGLLYQRKGRYLIHRVPRSAGKDFAEPLLFASAGQFPWRDDRKKSLYLMAVAFIWRKTGPYLEPNTRTAVCEPRSPPSASAVADEPHCCHSSVISRSAAAAGLKACSGERSPLPAYLRHRTYNPAANSHHNLTPASSCS